jgi:uncharacterized membrane protein YjjB (DUF3815 family)
VGARGGRSGGAGDAHRLGCGRAAAADRAAAFPGTLRRVRRVVAVSALATRVPLSTYLSTLGGLIVWLPGLTLSMAMSELNAQHLVSGTARLTGAIMRFLALMFGVALGSRVAQLAFGAATPACPWPCRRGASGWRCSWRRSRSPCSCARGPRTRRRSSACACSRCSAAAPARARSGPSWACSPGALVAGLASNLLARVRHTPALVTLSPALLLLVPGSVGFRSLALLLDREVVNGIEAAFRW